MMASVVVIDLLSRCLLVQRERHDKQVKKSRYSGDGLGERVVRTAVMTLVKQRANEILSGEAEKLDRDHDPGRDLARLDGSCSRMETWVWCF